MDFMNDKVRASNRATETDFSDQFPRDFLEVNLFESLGQVIDMIDTTKSILATLSLSKGLGTKGLPDPLEYYPMDNDELRILATEIESLAVDLVDVTNGYPTNPTPPTKQDRYNIIEKYNRKKGGLKIRNQLKKLNKMIAIAMNKNEQAN